MVYVVMAYIVMAQTRRSAGMDTYIVMALYSYGLCSYGLYSYGTDETFGGDAYPRSQNGRAQSVAYLHRHR